MKTITVKQQQKIAALVKKLEHQDNRYISITIENTDYGYNEGIESKFNYYEESTGHKYFQIPKDLIKFMEELI